MPEFICYMEDTTITSICITAPDMDEAEKKLDRILEAHGYDAAEIADAHNGEHHEGDMNTHIYPTTGIDMNTHIYPTKTDLTDNWTNKMYQEDLND